MPKPPQITMNDLSRLPDGNLHSKVSFLKRVLTSDNSQSILMQQRLSKYSYTIKNIGIHGQQIGITSKRLPLKNKQEVQMPKHPQNKYYQPQHIAHSTFFSHALIPCRKSLQVLRKPNTARQSNDLMISTINGGSLKNQFQQFQYNSQRKSTATQKQRAKSRSYHSLPRNKKVFSKLNPQKQKIFMQSVTDMKNSIHKDKKDKAILLKPLSSITRKSYAKMLQQCKIDQSKFIMVPVQHEQNPLFKRIQKIKLGFDQNFKDNNFKHKRTITNSTVFLGRYNTQSRNRFTSSSKIKVKKSNGFQRF